MLVVLGVAAVPVEMSASKQPSPRSEAQPPSNRPEPAARAMPISRVLRGGPRALSFSPQSVPAAWDFETVAPVAPLIPSGCGPFVEITGFDYDPSNRAVVGWDLHNHCNGIPGSRWARKESGNWNINVFEPNILFPGGGDSDYAHQLAVSDDGTAFMVYGALAQPWNDPTKRTRRPDRTTVSLQRLPAEWVKIRPGLLTWRGGPESPHAHRMHVTGRNI